MKPIVETIERIIDDDETKVFKNGNLIDIITVDGFVSSTSLRRLVLDYTVYQSMMGGLRIGAKV